MYFSFTLISIHQFHSLHTQPSGDLFDCSMDTTQSSEMVGPQQFYKQLVAELVQTGALDGYRQKPIRQETLNFLLSRQKDPVSMLHIYCATSGEPSFPFFGFELDGRPDPNKFLSITELDGKPVVGICTASKKEAKKACALRLLDVLMTAGRLECISETGRKLKRLPPKPLPTTTHQELPSAEGGQLLEQCHQQQEISFSEDINLDKMQQEFEANNPLPDDCKNVDEFKKIRSTAFNWHCENAFWREFQISELTRARMEQWRMSNNPVAFVTRCLTIIANQEVAKMLEVEQSENQEQEDTDNRRQQNAQPTTPQPLNYYTFNLPYIPPRYASLILFEGRVYHGRIAISKQKARMSCAEVIAEKLVQDGKADVAQMARAKKRKGSQTALKERKKQKAAADQMKDESLIAADGAFLAEPHQFLLTLHPREQLDPRTHFYLATHPKNPVMLLNELAAQNGSAVVEYEFVENKDAAKNKWTARAKQPNQSFPNMAGAAEETKKAARCSAARMALNELILLRQIPISEEAFNVFRDSVKNAGVCGGCASNGSGKCEQREQQLVEQQQEPELASSPNFWRPVLGFGVGQ